MTPESLIQFKNLKNQTGEDLVGMILHDLSGKTNEGNAKLETISEQLARSEGEEGLREMEERMDRRAAQEVLIGIKEAIEGKDVDLTQVLLGLVSIVKEIRSGNEEAKAFLQDIQAKEHTDITAALSSIYEKMCEEKIEKPEDFTPIIESQKQGFDEVVRVLSGLALAINERHETESVKIEGEVKVSKPSWWKEYVLDWKPLEKLLNPIKDVLEKILAKKAQELPIKDGRVLVSIDKRVGGGLGNPFSFDDDGKLRVASNQIIKKTVALTVSGVVHTPSSGKAIRLYSVKFSLSADMTDIAFNFGAGLDFEKYLAPKGGGLYGGNTHPDYIDGGVNESLDCVINGTGTVQVNIEYLEI